MMILFYIFALLVVLLLWAILQGITATLDRNARIHTEYLHSILQRLNSMKD